MSAKDYFGLELDVEEIAAVPLNDVALETATQAAYDAVHAGLEPQEELERAVKGYIWACQQLSEAAKPGGCKAVDAALAAHNGARERIRVRV